MEQEKIIDFMDKLEEAEVALESMHHISILLMDAYRAHFGRITSNCCVSIRFLLSQVDESIKREQQH